MRSRDRVPHSTPLRDPSLSSPHLVPPRNISAAGCLAASLPRDSLSTSSPNLHQNHYNRPRPLPLYILHIINYLFRSWTTNLAHPPSCHPPSCPRQPFRGPSRVSSVTHKIGKYFKQEIDLIYERLAGISKTTFRNHRRDELPCGNFLTNLVFPSLRKIEITYV